ncbi:MAG: GTPase HflX, partial [Candidatus Omnitrophica bacterium]|nr:GTPase HflX [Candidatus Omnitrophota bacterium]
SDTVGFLHQLPHHLIEAFKATLEEVIEADLLIHVLDISHKMSEEHAKAVYAVLKELGVDTKPMITALNKVDLLEDKSWARVCEKSISESIAISAKTRENIDVLLKRIQEEFAFRLVNLYLEIPMKRMDLVDLFYRKGNVREIKYQEKNIKIKLSLPKSIAYNILQDKEIKKIA